MGCCGANDPITSLDIQSDGKILVGGQFTRIGKETKNRIARLNPDGSLDTSFDLGDGPNDRVLDVTIQGDGKILIGGDFTSVNGLSSGRFARLDGSTSPLFTSIAPSQPELGKPYSHTFTTTGYPFAPTIHFLTGSIPPGLILDIANSSLYGIPTSAGTYHFVLTASNWIAPNDEQEVTLIIDKAPSSTTITYHNPNPSKFGDPVIVDYSVTSTSGTPSGEVIVGDGVVSCTGTVADGSCSLSFTTPGYKTITAKYVGDQNFKESISAAVEQSVILKLFIPFLSH